MDVEALVADAPVLAGMRRDLRSFGWGNKEFGVPAHAGDSQSFTLG
jgi:hypothetical protein